MPQSRNPFFHSQARRKSESAAIPIRDRNVERNTAMSHTLRNPFAPPVPPKDGSVETLSTPSTTDEANSTLDTLDTLEMNWMLNDCLGLMPTPMSEGSIAQEYIPSNFNAKGRRDSQESLHDGILDTVSALRPSNGRPQNIETSFKARAAKRDTVADMLKDMIGSNQVVLRKHQDVLDAAATLGAMPLPLRIPNKLGKSLHDSSIAPRSKFTSLDLGGRPSLQIASTFAEPRTAPVPLAVCRRHTKQISSSHGRKSTPSRTSVINWLLPFRKDSQKIQRTSTVPTTLRKRSKSSKINVHARETKTPQQQQSPPRTIKHRRANTFPEYKTVHRVNHTRNARPVPTVPPRKTTQAIKIDRMSDPDEAFNKLLALRNHATAKLNGLAAAPAPSTATPNPANVEFESVAKAECSGLYTTARSHVNDAIEQVKSVRRKERARRRRKEMMEEVRRKYEEMAGAVEGADRHRNVDANLKARCVKGMDMDMDMDAGLDEEEYETF